MLTSIVTSVVRVSLFLWHRLRQPTPAQVEVSRENRADLLSLANLVNEARRRKLQAFQARTPQAGRKLVEARNDMKNFAHNHPEIRVRLWPLVRCFDAALRDPRRRDAGPEFHALEEAIRMWLAEIS